MATPASTAHIARVLVVEDEPKVAIIDPELTLSLGPATTAASGLDALTQAIESHLSKGAHAASQALALAAVRLLMRWLPAAYADGSDREARIRVAEGSMLSAMAFGHLLDLPHGYTCAVLLPIVLRWNAPSRPDEFAELATTCRLADGPAFLAAVADLVHRLGIPATLATLDLDRHAAYIVANCRSGSMKANPRALSDDDVRTILRELIPSA